MQRCRAQLFFILGATLLASAPLVYAQDITLETAPSRYLTIQVEGANRVWEVRPEWISSRTGASLANAGKGDLALKLQRWERTGLPKRYDTTLWRKAFELWTGPSSNAPEDARFYFYAINPRQPRVEAAGVLNLVDERRRLYWVPPRKVTIVGYPRTWVDIFEGYVNQFSGEERREAVKRWEEAHRELIANVDDKEDGFSPEERNEFARFYQAQFVYIRDRNPKLATIYDELAAFHRERNNLDAELSTYLGALRSGVESPDRERFALAVGRIFVQRLRLYEPAIPHLKQALNFAESRILLSTCLIMLKRFDEARVEIIDLGAMLETGELELQPESTIEQVQGRAWLELAALEFSLQNYVAANAALERIPEGNPSYEAGRVLYCAMLLHRNLPRRGEEKGDFAKVRDVLKTISWWKDALAYGTPQPDRQYPLNPLMAEALLVYVQTDSQFQQTPRPDKPTVPRADIMSMIDAAKALAPLSAEPYLAECRLQQRLGNFRDALAAAMAGLDVNPQHVLLNYTAADIHMKAGLYVVAQDHLSRCLKADPDFYPALVMMAEIALTDIERIRNSIQVRQTAGEKVDVAGELVPPMKEAAAFFSAALAIHADQPATTLALATLYLRLAETAPLAIGNSADREQLRRAYLAKARDLAQGLMRELEAYANGPKLSNPTEREIADVPNLACYNVYAFAQYNLGDVNAAKAAFGDHIARAADKRYFPESGAHAAYQRSNALQYAREWLRRIDENQRQYYDVEQFTEDSKGDYYNDWRVVLTPKPDGGFTGATRMQGGKLILGADQKEGGIPSRIERVQPWSTLAAFEAEFVSLGSDYWDRGVAFTKYSKPTSGLTDRPEGTVMVGIDAELRLYWETRRFQNDNANEPEVQLDAGYIDVGDYGGVPLKAGEPLRLGIRRQLAEDGSRVRYYALINGHEVLLPLKNDDRMTTNDIANSSLKAACGFFVNAAAGTKAQTHVESVRFIFDSGLGEKRK